MAFQPIRAPSATKESVKLSALEVGQSVEGYIISGPRESVNFPGSYSVMVQDEDGERFYMNLAGSAKYDFLDGRVRVGLLTRITRLNDRKMKNGRSMSNFEILQDPEKTIDDISFNQIPSTRDEETRKAVERASVKEQARRLSEAIKRR